MSKYYVIEWSVNQRKGSDVFTSKKAMNEYIKNTGFKGSLTRLDIEELNGLQLNEYIEEYKKNTKAFPIVFH